MLSLDSMSKYKNTILDKKIVAKLNKVIYNRLHIKKCKKIFIMENIASNFDITEIFERHIDNITNISTVEMLV